MLPATIAIRSSVLRNYLAHPALFIIPALVLASLAGMMIFTWQHPGVVCLPVVLRVSGLSARRSSSSDLPCSATFIERPGGRYHSRRSTGRSHCLHVGLAWWAFGIALALLYFVTSYRMSCGKVFGEGGCGQ